MDITQLILTIVGASLGSAGLFSLIQFLISRHDNKNQRLKTIEKKIDEVIEKANRNEQATTRLQLFLLIYREPQNKDAILRTAQRYFIDLDGNGEAWEKFHSWAQKMNISTGWYQMLIKKEQERS